MEIEKLLPHRKPFLFVDEILEATQEKIVGTKTFTLEEFFFPGHFPGYPVVPGVILVETMAQVGGAGMAKLGVLENKIFFFATADKVKFRKQVKPNDTVRIEVTNIRVSPRMLRQSGRVLLGDEVAAEAEWMCLVGDVP